MKTIFKIIALAACLFTSPALAQFSQDAVVGSSGGGTPGGTSGQFQFNNSSAFGGYDAYPGYISGNWYMPVSAGSLTGGNAYPANTISCNFQFIPATITITNLGVGIGTAGTTNAQIAIYSNGANHRPASLTGKTASIVNAVSGNTQISGALLVNKSVGPAGTDGGANLWFCFNQNDSTGSYAVSQVGNYTQNAMIGDATLSNVIYGPGNNSIGGIQCQGAACQGGVSTFGTWPASLGTTTWTPTMPGSTGQISPIVAFKVQ